MLYKTFHDFQIATVALPHRLLCLDVGTKTIGLAVSDRECKIGSPLKTLQRNRGDDFKQIATVVKEYEVKSLIVGYPLHFNGEAGERCQYVEAYMAKLQEHLFIPALLWDERMSTLSAERLMLEGDLSRSRRSESIDSVAASIILQSFLDFFRYHG